MFQMYWNIHKIIPFTNETYHLGCLETGRAYLVVVPKYKDLTRPCKGPAPPLHPPAPFFRQRRKMGPFFGKKNCLEQRSQKSGVSEIGGLIFSGEDSLD